MTTGTADMTTTSRIQAIEAEHVLQTYRRFPVAFVRGEGVYLYDAEGRRYLDLLAGIGVASLGHAHRGLADALADQARTLAHTSNLFFHPLQGVLAERLARVSGLPRAFFCNSGTEANEACLKFARRYWHTKGETARTAFVAFDHAFAGRTMGSLSVTWDEHYRGPFGPLVPGVTFVPSADPAALDVAVTSRTAAIIVEPIQGEGGVRPISPELARAIEAACARTGALLIADEVQSGTGRTGEMFHFPAAGLTPDLVSVGKAIGGGFPLGAALVSAEVASTISAGDHGTTYGGNLLACRAGLCVLDELEGGLLEHIRAVAPVLERGLRAMVARLGIDADVRGKGLMWGIDLGRDAGAVVPAALARGLVVNRTAGSVVRLLPPYIITEAQIEEGLSLLEAALSDALGGTNGAR
ncbi:MAG TPA: acetylornithine/succinylornithine family transaminase [Vicinamibacterales bacterium]